MPVKEPTDESWIIYAAAAAAAALFLLAFLLLLFCCCKRRKKDPPSESSSAGFDSCNDAEFDLYSSAGIAERGHSRNSPPALPARPETNINNTGRNADRYNSAEDAHSTTELVRQASNNSFSSGDINAPLSPTQTAPLTNAISVMPAAPPPADRRFTRKKKKTAGRSKTPIESKISSGGTNEFQFVGDKKVATVIQRLAGRLRGKLSSIHFKDSGSRPRIPDQEGDNPEHEVDLSGNPDFWNLQEKRG